MILNFPGDLEVLLVEDGVWGEKEAQRDYGNTLGIKFNLDSP